MLIVIFNLLNLINISLYGNIDIVTFNSNLSFEGGQLFYISFILISIYLFFIHPYLPVKDEINTSTDKQNLFFLKDKKILGGSLDKENKTKIIIWLMTIGLILIIVNNDLFLFFLALEIYSISSFLLILNKKTDKNIKISINYFIISNISSILLLIGIAIIYRTYGTLNITILENIINPRISNEINLKEEWNKGMLIILIALIFKLGIFPFQTWLMEIYSIVSFKTLNIIIIYPKLVILLEILKLIPNIYNFNIYQFRDIENVIYNNYLINFFIFLIFASILISFIFLLNPLNNKIRRILSISSIVNVSQIMVFYVLLFFILSEISLDIIEIKNNREIIDRYKIEGIIKIINTYHNYLFFYLINTFIIVFIYLYTIPNISNFKENFWEIWGSINQKYKKYLYLNIFSLIGIPPLAGFYIKYKLFIEILNGYNLILLYLLALFIFITFLLTFIYLYPILPINKPDYKIRIIEYKGEENKYTFKIIFIISMVLLLYIQEEPYFNILFEFLSVL